MKNVIISCKTLKNEVEDIISDKPDDFECIWLEEQLHNKPLVLHEQIQNAIDSLIDADKIILIYGNCGGALNGITATHCPLILPKCEDCIDIMLYYNSDIKDIRRNSYFSSVGWLWGNEDLGYGYDKMKEKYGEARALRLTRAMYVNYKYLAFIETCENAKENAIQRSEVMAEKLGLEFKTIKGSMKLLQDMIEGNTDDRYIFVPKGETIVFSSIAK